MQNQQTRQGRASRTPLAVNHRSPALRRPNLPQGFRPGLEARHRPPKEQDQGARP